MVPKIAGNPDSLTPPSYRETLSGAPGADLLTELVIWGSAAGM